MIRIGLPAPALLRLRLRAQLAANRAARQFQAWRLNAQTTGSSLYALLLRLQPTNKAQSETIAPPVALTPRLQAEFSERYDDLIDLLCWASKDGIHDGRDARYAELRDWFLRHYEPLRPKLLPLLEAVPEEDCVPASASERIPRDAFESLYLPSDICLVINSDTVISRIMRTRAAMDRLLEP
jgi:hypothetical protein